MTVELQKSGATGPFWLEELLKAIMLGMAPLKNMMANLSTGGNKYRVSDCSIRVSRSLLHNLQ